MKYANSGTTVVTLAVGGELVTAIDQKVLGTEVADNLAGTPLSKEMVLNMAQSGIEKNLLNQSMEG